ncbi:hypothetical protein [Mesorhizobium sp. M0676]|uniref:hypothetical protein n=1 Tax=Mesorhizobium sp. M0676 TaxID=2956984 RepID=UPI00333B657E
MRDAAPCKDDIDLVSSDYPQAISFLANEFKIKAIQSRSIPEEAVFGRLYDAVLALSFFSHMPITTGRDGWFVCSALCGLVAFWFSQLTARDPCLFFKWRRTE